MHPKLKQLFHNHRFSTITITSDTVKFSKGQFSQVLIIIRYLLVKRRLKLKLSKVMRLVKFCNLVVYGKVRWAQQQVVKRRTKRDGLLEVSNAGVSPRTTRSINYNLNDPGWIHMWYLVSSLSILSCILFLLTHENFFFFFFLYVIE